jgi:hypothetical protein
MTATPAFARAGSWCCPARAVSARRRGGYGHRQRLGPARLRVSEVGSTPDRDKNLRGADLAGEPVDDHRHRVAGVIDKQFVAAHCLA